jgi:hypothetical protein
MSREKSKKNKKSEKIIVDKRPYAFGSIPLDKAKKHVQKSNTMEKVKPKNKGGRPKKYDPKITPQLAKWMCRSGLTDEQMSKELGVSVATIHNWKKKYPEFLDSLKEPKDFIDSLVEDSLLKRALGYEYEEIKTIAKKDKDGEIKTTRIEKTRKMVVPDVTAQLAWLNNRKPEQWRRKVEQGGEFVESLAETLSKMADRLPG